MVTFPYCWEPASGKQNHLLIRLEAGGKISELLSHIVGWEGHFLILLGGEVILSYCWVGRSLSYTVGWENHVLMLLGAGGKGHVLMLLGAGGKVTFSYCWGKVTFPILYCPISNVKIMRK